MIIPTFSLSVISLPFFPLSPSSLLVPPSQSAQYNIVSTVFLAHMGYCVYVDKHIVYEAVIFPKLTLKYSYTSPVPIVSVS